MNILIAYLLVLHFVADFLLQTRDMGKRKSAEPKILALHLLIQVLVIGAGLDYAGFDIESTIKFTLANAAIHGVIDWFIWRIYKKSVMIRVRNMLKPQQYHMYKDECLNFKYWEDHWFYSTIGMDQLLHGLTLVALAGAFL